MPIANAQAIVDKLIAFQAEVREVIRVSHTKGVDNAAVAHSSAADTIYAIDADVDPILIDLCEQWGKEQPLILVAEGIHDEHGVEGPRVFPTGTPKERAEIILIVDPIDGTRGIMYDKRPAWALAAVAPNKGVTTQLSDCEISVMSELPTSKMGYADVLYAIKGQGARGFRVDLKTHNRTELTLSPSKADTIKHGFAGVSDFFPGTKVQAGELMERIVAATIGKADVTKAMVFEDQYICTGGQFYELIVGHDRFNCDLRPLFYKLLGGPEGLCVHPYDVGGLLVAQEAGVIITDGLGGALDGPLDTTTSLSWAGYANATLRDQIQPVISAFFARR
jgi:fructose-1,6-bisphosphatase/inositol monophosphatase family enzyme